MGGHHYIKECDAHSNVLNLCRQVQRARFFTVLNRNINPLTPIMRNMSNLFSVSDPLYRSHLPLPLTSQ